LNRSEELRIYHHWHGVRVCRRHSTNTSNKGLCLRFGRPDADGTRFSSDTTKGADIDVVTAGREITASVAANGDVVIAGCVAERLIPGGRVVASGNVVEERVGTGSRVL